MCCMKMLSFLFLLVIGSVLAFSPVLAQDEVDEEATVEKSESGKKKKKGKKSREKTEAASAKPAASRVIEALGKFKVFNAKPNPRAEYFVFLYSASWCGYCQQCIPVAVDQYRKIKASRKVELIIICGDKSEAEAKAYLKSHKAKAPCILFSELEATQFQGLPGSGVFGFPAVSVCDKDGNVISNEIGASKVKAVLEDWRKLTLGK